MHEVLVNRLGGLSLPRKSVVRLTDRPDMTLDVYRGRKTTMQQYYDNPLSVYLCPTPSHPHTRRHQSGQLVYVPSPRVCFKSQRSRVRYPVRPHTFVSPSADSSRAVVSFWRKYVHKVLVNRLGGLRKVWVS